jgi:hypothetical protein
MGERHDLPKIKPDEKPSLFNTEAAYWGLLGSVVGGIGSYIGRGSVAVRIAVDLAFTGAGFLYGGTQGMARQEREQNSGRVVKTPGFWNSGILSGFFVSNLIQAPLTYYVHFKEMTPKAYGRALTASGIITLGGMIAGSIMRKDSLQRDFDKAVAIRDANHAKTQQLLEAAIAQQHAPTAPTMDETLSFKNSVTPDEAALLMEKQAQATPPVAPKPAHGPEHKPHTDHAAQGDAAGLEHDAAHGEYHSEHHGEHHDAPSHAAKHEQHQHTGSHAAKHEPAASHIDHVEKPEAGMAMSA